MRPATQFLACWVLAASLSHAQTVDLGSSIGRYVIDGPSAGAHWGAWLHMGDVTGDFYNKELIVGAPDENSGRGTVRLFIGRQRTPGDLVSADADVVLTGGAAGDRFGASVDAGFVTVEEMLLVNGNPAGPLRPRDLIVGAPGAYGGRGAVYVFPGGFSTGMTRTPANAAYTIIGAAAGDHLGAEVETGDLTGDAYREIILPVPARGVVYVLNVRSAATVVDLSAGVPGTVMSGFGSAISVAADDVTGDGVFDLAIGDPTAHAGSGVVYLLRGPFTLTPAMAFPARADASMMGADPGDQLGASLWIADIDDDADPAAELIVGAPGASGPGNARPQAGEVHVIWGSAVIASAFRPGLTFYGAASGHRLGAVLTAGDVTRDAPDDIVMLAPGANGGTGEVFVYYGRHSWDFPAGPLDIGTAGNRRLVGHAAAGPIRAVRVWEGTGEGAEEIVIGAPLANTAGGAQAGRVYVPLSPRIEPEVRALSLRVMQGSTFSAALPVANFSAVPVYLRATANAGWLSVSPVNSSARAGAPAALAVIANAAALGPGEHKGRVTLASTTRDLAMSLPVDVTVRVLAPPSLTASFLRSAPIGEPVTWTATADTSVGPVEYLFRRYSPAAGWVTVQAYSASNSFTWTPGEADSGRYAIEVWVRAVGSTVAVEAHTSTGYFTVGDAAALFVLSQKTDFDGDGRADPSVYRPSNGTWYALLSSAHYGASLYRPWGISTDVPVPGDYDGDGRTDLAVYRPSNGGWYVLYSGSGYATSMAKPWGIATDIPVPGDYDGDGRADPAVFRPSNGTWYVMLSSHGYGASLARPWGLASDVPVPGDYDGDGRTDFAVFRPSNGTWYVLESISGFARSFSRAWGVATDRPVPGDFDGDGRTDFAVFRPTTGTWYVLRSSTGFSTAFTLNWGVASDLPVPGDFNGDRRTDIAVFRPGSGTWFVWNQFSRAWGTGTDIPLLMK